MQRVELLAVFYSLERLLETKDYDGATKVVKKVIDEAEVKKKTSKN